MDKVKDKLANILYYGLPILGYCFVGLLVILFVLIAPFDFWSWVFYLGILAIGLLSILGFFKLYFWASDRVEEIEEKKNENQIS